MSRRIRRSHRKHSTAGGDRFQYREKVCGIRRLPLPARREIVCGQRDGDLPGCAAEPCAPVHRTGKGGKRPHVRRGMHRDGVRQVCHAAIHQALSLLLQPNYRRSHTPRRARRQPQDSTQASALKFQLAPIQNRLPGIRTESRGCIRFVELDWRSPQGLEDRRSNPSWERRKLADPSFRCFARSKCPFSTVFHAALRVCLRLTPSLGTFAASMGTARPRKRLVMDAAEHARKTASLLGVQCCPLSEGRYDHPLPITLLDPDGRWLTSTTALLRQLAAASGSVPRQCQTKSLARRAMS